MKLNRIKVPHYKGTSECQTVKLPIPPRLVVPMCQHMGAVCEPLVKKGDKVLRGQVIGDSDAFLSCPIHAPTSATVTDIIEFLPANGKTCQALVLEPDGEHTVDPEVKPPVVEDRASFLKAVRDSGCCGLGGAGFPTHVKLGYDREKFKVDSLVVNAAECEPYITSDYRELIGRTEDVVEGIKDLMKWLEIPKAYLCIENNKPKAIELMKNAKNDDRIEVVTLKSEYPQGAEKVIAFAATGRIIKEGELPINQGVLVINVSTVGFIHRYLTTGMGLVEKRLTLDGDLVKKPLNVRALIGAETSWVLSHAEADIENAYKIISGGPMMGSCLMSADTPVLKTNNAILVFSTEIENKTTACIRCGKCIGACPLGLMPAELERAYIAKDTELLKKLGLSLCMNCGSCSYVCPAKRNLAQTNQLAKALLRK